VRRLADRSKALAADISTITESAESETTATVLAMEEGAAQLQIGLGLMEQVAEASSNVRSPPSSSSPRRSRWWRRWSRSAWPAARCPPPPSRLPWPRAGRPRWRGPPDRRLRALRPGRPTSAAHRAPARDVDGSAGATDPRFAGYRRRLITVGSVDRAGEGPPAGPRPVPQPWSDGSPTGMAAACTGRSDRGCAGGKRNSSLMARAMARGRAPERRPATRGWWGTATWAIRQPRTGLVEQLRVDQGTPGFKGERIPGPRAASASGAQSTSR